jgi:hypothetical protein
MTVESSTVTTVKTGRVADALAVSKTFNELIARHGAKNLRTMLLMSSTPMRLGSSHEADDQAALGKIADGLRADPDFEPLMNEAFGVSEPSDGYVTENWIEV